MTQKKINNMKPHQTALSIIAFMVLSGCGIQQGYVTNKYHVPERCGYTRRTVQSFENGEFSSENIEVYECKEEAWIVEIQAENDKGKLRTNAFNVNERMYRSLRVGDWYEQGR